MKRKASAATKSVNDTFRRMGTSYTRLRKDAVTTASGIDKVTTATKKQKRSILSLIPHVAMVTASYMAMRAAWRGVLAGLMVGVQFEQKMAYIERFYKFDP